ncbi:MAG: ribonuclease E/G [Peptoniphilus sp.]|nr:ribonuclease E/G [Peptoniphilus sp.]MDD7363685.1 ribonuclease E/G [Bacillota bacterium]MDY6044070.1 ribonuclease E/G [Peptoniphilus sp.]
MKYNSNRYLFIDAEAPRLIGLIEDDDIRAVHVLSRDSKVGNIYRGYVKNTLPAMDCAFVDFGHKETGYLPMKNVYPKSYRDEIKGGDAVIVEVKKMPIREKRAVLTLDYSLRGEYLVLLPESKGIRMSKKIKDKTIRGELMRWASDLQPEIGMIIRTEAASADRRALEREYLYLYDLYERIERSRNFLPPTELLRTQDDTLDIFNRYGDLPVVVNDKKLSERVVGEREIIVDPSFSIRSTPKWRSRFNSIFAKIVGLPSGGNIVVNTAEACHVIDVNSGTVKDDSSFGAMRRRVNLEAARVIARQIKLRNLSGMIVLDFLHGMSESEKEELTAYMSDAFLDDLQITTVYGFTAMGLFEIARQRSDLEFEEQYRRAKKKYQDAMKEKIKDGKEL